MRNRTVLRCIARTSASSPCRRLHHRIAGPPVCHFSAASVSTDRAADDARHSVRLSPPCPPAASTPSTSNHITVTAPPVTVAEFSTLLTRAGIPPTHRLAVALSGGADSSALALLAHYESQLPHSRRPPPLILQVDHRLRPESTAETAYCRHWLSQLPPPLSTHVVLPLQWGGGRPAVNRLQEVARDRRREAMVRECGVRRVRWLLLAHHADDQLETIVHRWTRGSGLYGLTGMAVTRIISSYPSANEAAMEHEESTKDEWRDGSSSSGAEVVLCRPLLSVSKARVVATCQQYGVRWVEDVSNNNRAFERIRIRQALTAMLHHHSSPPHPSAPSDASTPPPLPLTAAVLAGVPAVLSSCHQSVHDVTTTLLRRHATFVSPFSVAFLSASAATLPFPVLLLLFSRLLAVVCGSIHLPLGEPLHRLVRSLLQDNDRHSTAAAAVSDDVIVSRRQGFGCVVSTLQSGGRHKRRSGWMVTRTLEQVGEVAVQRDSSTEQQLPWDDRFTVQLYLPPASTRIPAGCHSVDYVLRPLRKDDLSLFQLPKRSSTGELRHTLLTGLPLLVRRWTGSKVVVGAGGGGGEDVVLLPHVPFLPMKEVRWDAAERLRRAGDDEIQLTVTRLKGRVSKWDWTQHEGAAHKNVPTYTET